ncbi:MAG TPA: hypothetical protein VK054_13155 [Beutenbergiaceae bacterium]|nr:hypothetical protein [Beutenbergiaceae bacterium]
MSDHHCEGLARCNKHPRWHVMRELGMWRAYGPGLLWYADFAHFPTHAEAINYATKRARKEATR